MEANLLGEKSVLVVDDQELVHGILHKMLCSIGVACVEHAMDGSEALKKLDRADFDVILCDIRMKPMSGIEFVDRLRRSANERYSGRKSRTPVLFLTASDDRADIAEARRIGVQGYLLKPINEQSLKARLLKTLG